MNHNDPSGLDCQLADDGTGHFVLNCDEHPAWVPLIGIPPMGEGGHVFYMPFSGGGGAWAGKVAEDAMKQLAIMMFSADCQSFLLGTVGDVLTKVKDTASTARVVDASTVNTPTGAAAFPHDPTLAAAQQARDDAQTGISGTSIAQLFASSGRLYAMGQYNGNTVFYGQAFATFGSGYALYTMFHEVLHLRGLSDQQLRTAFAISDAAWAAPRSTAITIALMAGCGH